MDVEKLKLEIKEQEAIIEKKNEKIYAANAQLLLAPIKEDGTLLPHIQSAINGIDEQIVKLNEQMEEAQTKKFHLEIKLAETQGDVEEKADFEEQLQRLKSKAKKREANDLVDDIERKKSKTESFWTELMEADLKSDVIEFSDHPFLDDQLPKHLWIRPKVFEDYCGYIEEAWKKKKYVYLSGSPGIGKSSFALYFMAHLLKTVKAKEIVYSRRNEYFLLNATDCHRVTQRQVNDAVITEKLESEDVIAVFDSPNFQPPVLGKAKILLISSPKCKSTGDSFYKDLVKEILCKRLYFPRMEHSEVESMLLKVPKTVDATMEQIEESAGVGVARAYYVDGFIDDQKGRRMKAKEKYVKHLGTNNVDGAPHCIVAIIPVIEETTKLPSEYYLDFSCEEAKRNVMGWEVTKEDMKHIQDDAFHELSRSAGVSFEIFAHAHFSGGGSQSLFKYKVDGNFFDSAFAIQFTGSRCPFPKLTIPPEIKYGNYYVPDVPTFGSVDSFGLTTIPKGTDTFKKQRHPLFLFQMTISETHSFDVEAVKKLISDIREVNKEFETVCFVWVLRGQPFKPKGGIINFKGPGYKLYHFRYDLKK